METTTLTVGASVSASGRISRVGPQAVRDASSDIIAPAPTSPFLLRDSTSGTSTDGPAR